MNTNITTDNYEAYLLDYMEGNLSPDEAEQLKAFVTAQGMDWDELTEELPQLEAPQIVYQDKNKLRSLSLSKGRPDNNRTIPLYVKIASAAAAAGLLLTITLWPDRQRPQMEPIAELKAIVPGRLILSNEIPALPQRTIQFVPTQPITRERPGIKEREETPILREKVETPPVAELSPIKTQALPTAPIDDAPDFALLAYRMSTDLAIAQMEGNGLDDYDDERNHSLIGRGLYQLTNGRHDNFASLIGSGVRRAKQDLTDIATDMAMAAYQRADERIEEARERWEERRNE